MGWNNFVDRVPMNTPIHLVYKNANNIYFKREDFIPYCFGGNKARKALYFFNEIDRLKCDSVVTYGSSSSNHCRVIANMAASRNIPCHIIGPEEASDKTFNSTMMDLFNAKIQVVSINKVHDTIEKTISVLKATGQRPYFIEGGGHGNLGTQAYVDCYAEILEYERQSCIHFDYIFFASGTGTTHAGLVCGQLLNMDSRKIIGISIARKNPRGRQVVIDSVKSFLKDKNVKISDSDISDATIFLDEYTGDGYASSNPHINETIRTLLVETGIPLDSTYTGKAYTAMLHIIKSQEIEGKNILFIHTGGTPLFFDYLLKIGTTGLIK